MTSLFRTFSRAVTCAGLAALGWSVVAQAQGPTVFNACVTPLTGLLYQPKEAGKCFLPSHQPIKWTDALGAILSGSVANGDLDGTYPNPKVDGLRGRPVADVAPTTNQILAWNGTAWAPKDPSGGGAVGTAGGALTGTYPNPALAEGAVTNASLANGSVTEPKLAFNPATQEELDAAIATARAATATLQTNINAVNEAITAYKALLSNPGGTIDAASNPVSWTQLKDVPSAVTTGGGGSGISGWEQVSAFGRVNANGFGTFTAVCPTGKKPLGGGYFASVSRTIVFGSYPTPTGWEVNLLDPDPSLGTVTNAVYAICADAAS